MSLPRSLKAFFVEALVLGVACLGCEAVREHVLHLGPAYLGGDLSDFYAFAPIMPHLGQFQFLTMPLSSGDSSQMYRYPAPVALFYAALYALPHKSWVMHALIVLSFAGGGLLLARALARRGLRCATIVLVLAGALTATYPMWFEWENGNMEIFVFLFVALGLIAFQRDRLALAAVLLGVAASMKIYPAVLLGLFFARRRYDCVAIAGLVAAAVTLAALAIVTPSISYSWHGIGKGIDAYNKQFFTGVSGAIGFDHALLTVPKRVDAEFFGLRGLRQIFIGYAATIAVGGVALFFLRIRHLPVLNQIILLSMAAIFFTPSSFDYTLLHLYFPCAMLVLLAIDTANVETPGLLALLVCFAGLLAPLSEFSRHGFVFGGQVRALIAMAAIFLALKFPLQRQPAISVTA